MKSQLELLKTSRENIIKFLDQCTEEELIKVSANYNNNIYWNAAHMIASEQLLCYKLSGLPMLIEEDFVNLYKKGTKADEKTKVDLGGLKKLINSTFLQLEADYNKGLFKEFSPYITSYGVELTCIEDAIVFNNIHFAVHLGYMQAQKRGL